MNLRIFVLHLPHRQMDRRWVAYCADPIPTNILIRPDVVPPGVLYAPFDHPFAYGRTREEALTNLDRCIQERLASDAALDTTVTYP